MLSKVADVFRSDEFKATAAVFPDIDRERLAKDLNLKEEGRKRGEQNQPSPDSKTLDHVEMSAVSRIEELRRRGLETFESHRRIYSERLGRATAARMAVEQGTRDATSRFAQIVIEYQAKMVTPQEELEEAYAYRNQFRRENNLGKRPAQDAMGWGKIIALGLVMVIIESILNGYLFSQSNPMGLAGGVIAAVLVSAANVSISTFFGMGGKWVNARWRRIFSKSAGLLICIGWFGFAVIYNLSVAHFRDAVEHFGDWQEAGVAALGTLVADPAGLANMESWLLLTIGFFISTISFVKGFLSSDPYPGYSRVSRAVHDARDNYIHHLQDSIETLEEHRDETVNEMMETAEEVHRHINDSVDALFGQSYLISSARAFLEQCNVAANYCLSVYRDANKAGRDAKAPSYFSEVFSFQDVELQPIETTRKDEAERESGEINSLISRATQEIYDAYNAAVDAHRNIDEIQGTSYSKDSLRAELPITSGIKVVKHPNNRRHSPDDERAKEQTS